MSLSDKELIVTLRARLDALRGLVDELRNQLWAATETNRLMETKIAKLEREVQECNARQGVHGGH